MHGEPGVEVRRGHDGAEPERHDGVSLERRGHDIVMQGERSRVGVGSALDGTHDGHEIVQALKRDGATDARAWRAPRCREPVGDRVEVLVHAALAPRMGLRTFGGSLF